MKMSAKNIASGVVEIAKQEGAKKAASGLFTYLKKHNSLKLLPLVVLEIDKAAEAEGLVMATVVSKEALDQGQKNQIIQKIKQATGSTEVSLQNRVDPSIIGGIRISYGDKVLDLTISRQLSDLKTYITK